MTTPDAIASPVPHCAACGYSLRGLAADAPCPECGLIPRPGQRHPQLSDLGVEHISVLYRGATCATIGAGLVAVASITITVMWMCGASSMIHVPLVGIALGLASLIAGWLFLTVPGLDKGWSDRLTARVATWAVLCFALFAAIGFTVDNEMAKGLAVWPGLCAAGVWYFAGSLHLLRLGRACPASRLTRCRFHLLVLIPVVGIGGSIVPLLGGAVSGIIYAMILNTFRLELAVLRREMLGVGAL